MFNFMSMVYWSENASDSLQDVVSEPVFDGDLVYKLNTFVLWPSFADKFKQERYYNIQKGGKGSRPPPPNCKI